MTTYNDESEEIAELFATITNKEDKQRSNPRKKRYLFKERKNKKKTQKHQWEMLDDERMAKSSHYTNTVFGKSDRKPVHRQPSAPQTIAIHIPVIKMASIRKWIKSHRQALKRFFILLVVLVVMAASFRVYRQLSNSTDENPKNGAAMITPESVIIPSKLPDGYSIGSGAETLENGAKLYIVFDDKGNKISITQHAKPENFDKSIFTGAASFNTRLGEAYIIETVDRITGYILTNTTMLLFNSTGSITSSNMQKLMEMFQP